MAAAMMTSHGHLFPREAVTPYWRFRHFQRLLTARSASEYYQFVPQLIQINDWSESRWAELVLYDCLLEHVYGQACCAKLRAVTP